MLGAVASGAVAGTLACANRAGGHRRPDASLAARPDGDGWRLSGRRHWVLAADEVDEIAVVAQVEAGDCQRLLAKEAIQIHGGIGFTWEQDVHLYVKRIQSNEKLFGTSAEHRARIAERLGV